MDISLGTIQGYEGKANTTIELMLDIKKRFEETLEALRQENSEINAQLNNQDNKEEKDESSEDSEISRKTSKMKVKKLKKLSARQRSTQEARRRRFLTLPAPTLKREIKALYERIRIQRSQVKNF